MSQASLDTLIRSFEDSNSEEALWEALRREDNIYSPSQHVLNELLNFYLNKPEGQSNKNHAPAIKKAFFALELTFVKKTSTFKARQPANNKQVLEITEDILKGIISDITSKSYGVGNVYKQVTATILQRCTTCTKRSTEKPADGVEAKKEEPGLAEKCKELIRHVQLCRCDVQELTKKSQQNLVKLTSLTFNLINRIEEFSMGSTYRQQVKRLQESANDQHHALIKTASTLDETRALLLQQQPFTKGFHKRLKNFLKEYESFAKQQVALGACSTRLEDLNKEIYSQLQVLIAEKNTRVEDSVKENKPPNQPRNRVGGNVRWKWVPVKTKTPPPIAEFPLLFLPPSQPGSPRTALLSSRVIAAPVKSQPLPEGFIPYRLFF